MEELRAQQVAARKCSDYDTIINGYNGQVIENPDGSVSVFMPDGNDGFTPEILSKTCCEFIKPEYFFDIETQTCRWGQSNGCSIGDVFSLVINPKGNDGTIFYVEEGDSCTLNIEFKYLFKIKCETLFEILVGKTDSNCATPLDVFESFDASLTLDIVTSANTLQTVLEMPLFPAIGAGNLYTYLSTTPNSGFYVCGDSTDGCVPLSLNLTGETQPNETTCDGVMGNIIDGLFNESGLSGVTDGEDTFFSTLSSTALASQWVQFSTGVTDTNILSLIANQKIKISIKINSSCGDFCILLDDIVLDKVCTHVESNNIFLSQSPGFELERIRDNKKSWLNNTTFENRPFVISNNLGGNSIRQTNYDVNDERLVINSKEIDLDISIASAVETDVWCYINDNPCLLSGYTSDCKTFCGDNLIDFNGLLTQPLSAVTTIEDFEYYLTSELIDVKNRQTLSGYPTLRALYDRYMNSSLYCSTTSSAFSYLTMDQFAGLVGDYWVDIVEQVIPATTIWGSTKIYSNTIFDQQKYKYKAYSLQLCSNPFSGETVPSPINGTTGTCANVSVITTNIAMTTKPMQSSLSTTCESVCIAQMNAGSEFIGRVTVIGDIESQPTYNGNAAEQIGIFAD